jgi:hypothetical protein
VPIDSALGKILARNSNKEVDINDESSFPAYADQAIREQVSSMSGKLGEHSKAHEKLEERLESLASRVLGNTSKLDELDLIKSRIEDHSEKVENIKEVEKTVHALNLSFVDLKHLVEKSLMKSKEVEDSNAELRHTFATLSGVAEKLETMRNEFFQHVAKIEEVSRSNKALEGVEHRVREDTKMMTEMREIISVSTSETRDALNAAKTIKDEANLVKNDVNKTFMMIEDSRKAMADTIVEAHNERIEMKKVNDEIRLEVSDVRSSVSELEKRALGAIQELGVSLMSQMQNFVDSKKADVEIEFRKAEEDAVRQVTASAKIAEEIVQKEVTHAEQVAKAALDAADQTMKKIEAADERLKEQEHAAEAAVDAAQRVIENELQRVQTDVVGMEQGLMQTVNQIEERVKQVENQLADEAANIQNELASASDVMRDQEFPMHTLTEIYGIDHPRAGQLVHPEYEQIEAEMPVEMPSHHHMASPEASADDPERTMVIERAEDEARKLHEQVVESQETLEREHAALEDEQRKADADFAVAKKLYNEAESVHHQVEAEEHQMNHLAALLNSQENEAMKHPNNENVVEAMEQTQAEIQQLESNLEIVKARSSELEAEYAQASAALERETSQLEQDNAQFQSDKQAALVYSQEEEQADSLLREATTAYMHSESDVSPPPMVVHTPHVVEDNFAYLNRTHSPPPAPVIEDNFAYLNRNHGSPVHPAPTMNMYESASRRASMDAASPPNRPMTAAEQYLGHYLPPANEEWRHGQTYFRGGSGGSLNEAQKREAESMAMKTLLKMGIKPPTEAYKKLLAFVRHEAEVANKFVFITEDVLEQVLLGRKSK